MRNDKPNIIERLEQLIVSLENAKDALPAQAGGMPLVEGEIENAEGIAGEILTMLDGR